MADSKIGFLKLIIGATPVADQLREDIKKGGDTAIESTKKLQGVQYGMITGALVGFAAVTFEIIKATQASMMFESAFAGIRKTVDASDEEFGRLADNIKRMSTVIPVSSAELSRIGELGGQLGIAVQNLPQFISTVSTIATTTNLTVDGAALGLARLDAIAQTNGETFANIASTIVELGNNFAATESEIMTTVLRIAQAAAQVGATTEDALAFATALQAIGVPAQAGGTAVARVFQSIQSAIIQAGEEADIFASVAARSGKISSSAFADLFGEDPARAAQFFIEGLREMNESGEDVISVMDKLGLSQRRTTLAVLGLAEAEGLVGDTIDTARKAHEENIAATDEAIKRYTTLESQLKITANIFNELQIQIGDKTAPAFRYLNDTLQEFVLGLTRSNAAVPVLITFVGTLSVVMIKAIFMTDKLGQSLKAFGLTMKIVMEGTLGKVTLVITALAAIFAWIAKTNGQMEQLVRTTEAFSENGEVVDKTIKGLIRTTDEYIRRLKKYNEEVRTAIEMDLIEGLGGTQEERQAYIDFLENVINGNERLILLSERGFTQMGEDLQEAVTSGAMDYQQFLAEIDRLNTLFTYSPFQNLDTEQLDLLFKAMQSGDYVQYLKDESVALKENNRINKDKLKIAQQSARALKEFEDERDRKIRADAMEALGIKYLAQEGSHFRYVQEQQIKAYIEKNKLHQESAKAIAEEREAILELDTVYGTIGDNIKQTTDSFVADLTSLPEITAMTADEMVRNFKQRFALAQIFKDQMKQLEDLGYDDLALYASNLGPEFAMSLQNLLDDPKSLAAIEAGLEAQNITATETLKENTAKVIATYGEGYAKVGKDLTTNLLLGGIEGLDDKEQEYYDAIDRIISGGVKVANEAAGNQSPSWKMQRISQFMMLGLVKGVKDNYPTLEKTWKDTVIDLVSVIEQSVGDAMGRISQVFGSQFGLFGAQASLIESEQKYNELLEKRDKLLKGNTAQQTIAIREAKDKVEFLRIAYAEGTISAEELAIAEEELAEAEKAREKELAQLNSQIQQSQLQQAQAMFSLAQQAYELLQLGPEGINQFKEIAKVLGIDSKLIDQVASKTSELSNTIGTKFAGVVDKMAQDYYETNLKIEQEKIEINVDTSKADADLQAFIQRYSGKSIDFKINADGSFDIGGKTGYAGGGRIPMYANGGVHRSGYGLVGEYGPELIRAIPGGGVDITPLGNHGRSSITVQNLNVNVTGVPSDPGQARKAAIEIRKALHKLDREGLIGTGIRGR